LCITFSWFFARASRHSIRLVLTGNANDVAAFRGRVVGVAEKHSVAVIDEAGETFLLKNVSQACLDELNTLDKVENLDVEISLDDSKGKQR